MLCSHCLVLKFLITLYLYLCFVSKVGWDNGARVWAAEICQVVVSVCKHGHTPAVTAGQWCGCWTVGLVPQNTCMCLRTLWDPTGPPGWLGQNLSPDWWPWWGHNSRIPTEAGFEGSSGSSGPGLAEGHHMGACGRSAWLAVPGARRCGSRREARAWAWDGSCWRVGRSLCK